MTIFLNATEITAIKSRRNTEPWKTAYNSWITIANTAKTLGLQSVTAGGPIKSDCNPACTSHDFWVDTTSPTSSYKSYDYDAATKVGNAVRDLGLAYALTNDVSYAKKAIQLIFNWAIKAETKMSSKVLDNMTQIRISVTMPSLIYGADLIWGYNDATDGWGKSYNNGVTTKTYKEHFKDWTRALLNTIKARGDTGQNLDNWKLVLWGAAAALLNDTTELSAVIAKWKSYIPSHVNASNFMTGEITRTGHTLTYSTYAIQAMILTAEIAKYFPSITGYNLYGYKDGRGIGLESVLDKHDNYLSNYPTGGWPYSQVLITGKFPDYDLYELAYRYKQKTGYKAVITKFGRPCYNKRNILGPSTLTHGKSFTAATPSLEISSPSLNANWSPNTAKTITWNNIEPTDYPNVKIELKKNDVVKSVIVNSTPNDESYLWNIPKALESGIDYKIRVTWIDSAGVLSNITNHSEIFNITIITINDTPNNDTLNTILAFGGIFVVLILAFVLARQEKAKPQQGTYAETFEAYDTTSGYDAGMNYETDDLNY